MYAQVKAVRVREISAELAQAGIVAWMGAGPVDAPGYRQVVVVPGKSGDGQRELFLTIVQDRSRPVWSGRLQAACLAWARGWFASRDSGSA
jgi:hypothetical protein